MIDLAEKDIISDSKSVANYLVRTPYYLETTSPTPFPTSSPTKYPTLYPTKSDEVNTVLVTILGVVGCLSLCFVAFCCFCNNRGSRGNGERPVSMNQIDRRLGEV